MMESDERLSLYFEDALSNISEASVMENFMNSLNDINPTVNGLELLKYTCYDWRSAFCANERRLLKVFMQRNFTLTFYGLSVKIP